MWERMPLRKALKCEPALRNACSQDPNMNILAALLRAGASASARDCKGKTPLSAAIKGNNAAALAMMLAHKTCPKRAELSRELQRTVKGIYGGRHNQKPVGCAALRACWGVLLM